jgi:hypothetical protein
MAILQTGRKPVTLFCIVVLAFCTFIGGYAAWTEHWVVLTCAICVALFFIVCPEALDDED